MERRKEKEVEIPSLIRQLDLPWYSSALTVRQTSGDQHDYGSFDLQHQRSPGSMEGVYNKRTEEGMSAFVVNFWEKQKEKRLLAKPPESFMT